MFSVAGRMILAVCSFFEKGYWAVQIYKDEQKMYTI